MYSQYKSHVLKPVLFLGSNKESYSHEYINYNRHTDMKKALVLIISLTACMWSYGQQPREKTTFQTGAQWKPVTDVRADAVMCYGTNDRRRMTFEERVASWRERGYVTHFMTGIAWGDYQDYFTGRWDGKWHLDEGQKTMRGDTIWHGRMVPYIVPTENYMKYFKERHIKRVVDAGIDAIFLEEPEFLARSGYSEAFKREWQDYYGFPWRPQHESAENTYLSNKLKYHLYYRALGDAFTYAKDYGRQRGMNVRCYVPTHSLLNYAQWAIVSPEASLASMDCVDGYIAQVWTGTSREPNFYQGRQRERVFETALLEYGCMESMTRPTGRKMFFLTDPIEDRAKDWDDYKRNYQATFAAQLMYPSVSDYEIMPWPDRIYEGLYRVSKDSEERAHIPQFYSTQMQVMIGTLNSMPKSNNTVSGSQGVAVLMANSLMFQRSPRKVEGYDDPQLSNFYGEALPLVKRGVPVSIVHLENVAYPDTWKGVKVLLMSYSNMKPLDPEAHKHIAAWVKAGGRLIYSGRDDDAFQRVQEWWNKNGNSYGAPSEHLFQLMGMPEKAAEGEYKYGKGKVYVIRKDPKEFALKAGGDAELMDIVRKSYGRLEEKNSFLLQRGPYVIAAVVDESEAGDAPLQLKGDYIDLFSHELSYTSAPVVEPGTQAYLYDLRKVSDRRRPHIIASASRIYDEEHPSANEYRFMAKGPKNTKNIVCILLPRKSKGDIEVGCTSSNGSGNLSWEMKSLNVSSKTGEIMRLLWISTDNDPDGVHFTVRM